MKTQIFAFALIMVVAIGATFAPAMAAENTASEGSFTLGSEAPIVTSIALYESDGITSETAMDPTIEYVVKIVAADTDTLDDLSEIEVIIRVTGTSGMDDVNTKATYKWTNGATPVWTKEGPDGLWSLVTVGSTWPDPLTATSGEWVLHFESGPVAEEGTANWEIYAKATDNAALTGELTTTQKYDMNWRGEISAVDTSYDFGPIGLGDTDDEIITPTDKNIDVTAISNGNYELNSLTTSLWNCTDPVDDVTLDWDGTLNDVPSKGHFALEVSDTILSAATYVQETSQVIPGCDVEVITQSESGVTTEIYQWLSVATSGMLPGTYKGDYTVEISTR